MITFHHLLQELQKRQQVSTKLLSDVLDVSPSMMTQIRKGHKNPPLRHIGQMVDLFNLAEDAEKQLILSACATSIDPRLLAYIQELEDRLGIES